jgi:trk system potassium uptake protein TrkA
VTKVRTFSEEEGGGEMDYFELPEKHRMIELDTPQGLAGRSVAESGIRTRYGVSVLAVKRRTREGLERRFVPGPEDRFQPGDVLIVLGTEDAIERLRSA